MTLIAPGSQMLTLFCFIIPCMVASFTPLMVPWTTCSRQQRRPYFRNSHCTEQLPQHHKKLYRQTLQSAVDSANGEDSFGVVKGSSNRMTGFIRRFLDKNSRTTRSTTTPFSYLIAIPMDSCHELVLELESVQRAILYHCPILVHACIAPAMIRLPLLYVQRPPVPTTHANNNDEKAWNRGNPELDDSASRERLQQIVERTIRQHTYFTTECNSVDNTTSDTASDSFRTNNVLMTTRHDDRTRGDFIAKDDDDNDDESTNPESSIPIPWLVPFEGLEVDGPNNQVLYTVANPEAEGTVRLQAFVQKLRSVIEEEMGWNTLLPHDPQRQVVEPLPLSPHHQQQHEDCNSNNIFRPRVPFMRLPGNWKTILRKEYTDSRPTEPCTSARMVRNDDDDDDDDDDFLLFLTADQGGNGISPILWGQWMEDKFGGGGKTRMREVALYQPSQASCQASCHSNHETEQMFYLPEYAFPLPLGDAALSKHEGKFQAYQESREREAENQLRREKSRSSNDNDVDSGSSKDTAEDLIFKQTKERLERLYLEPKHNIAKKSADEDVSVEETVGCSTLRPLDEAGANQLGESSYLNDGDRQRIEKVISSRSKPRVEKELVRKKEKPPIADNPVFLSYKEGKVSLKNDTTLSTPDTAIVKLPPFPSPEHCTGFWRFFSSPTGFAVEDGSMDLGHNDNIILRIDGTIAGGPILDQVTRQKASGGTWRLMSSINEGNDENMNPILRIRLVIPPRKERILVMEGVLRKGSMLPSGLPLASATFQIPFLEKRKLRFESTESNDLLHCTGDVWIEDAVTGRSRDMVGKFSIMKMELPTDPDQYTITVPRPVRSQD